MNSALIWGLVIASVTIVGGMTISVFILKLALPPYYQEKLMILENQSKERLALIEKGISPDLLFKKEKKAWHDPLFWGLLMVGVGWGALRGAAVKGGSAVSINALAIFFGGLGLIIYYFVRNRSDRQKGL